MKNRSNEICSNEIRSNEIRTRREPSVLLKNLIQNSIASNTTLKISFAMPKESLKSNKCFSSPTANIHQVVSLHEMCEMMPTIGVEIMKENEGPFKNLHAKTFCFSTTTIKLL